MFILGFFIGGFAVLVSLVAIAKYVQKKHDDEMLERFKDFENSKNFKESVDKSN